MNTFYHGDCLFVLKHDIAPESVDLIYLDPPFFTGKVQKGKWRPEAMEISYQDSKRFWAEKAETMREKAPMWLRHIALKRPDFASYLWYMMERLEACRRVLKSTGSIYLHSDWRASHYLKMVMDEVFRDENFQNEIVWEYGVGGVSKQRWARKHDSILFYTLHKKGWTFNVGEVREPYRSPEKVMYKVVKGKEYLRKHPLGRVPHDVWDIPSITNTAKERVGYPTQKPEALLGRIIKASSNEGDLILDPFCGCGTTVIVASKLNRDWIGIDIDTSPRKPGELPTAFQVIFNRSHVLFQAGKYISRDVSEIKELDGRGFEAWVNEFYQAIKPQPDRGVDGITPDGIPIQAKTFPIKYNVLSQFVNDVKYHPQVPKPIKEVVVVSQSGFDDSARKRQFEIETTEGIKVRLQTPETMLALAISTRR